MIKYFFTIYIIFLIAIPDLAGQRDVKTSELLDSLKVNLAVNTDESLTVDLLNHICTKYLYVNQDSAIRYGQLAIEEAEKTNNEQGGLFAMGLLGEALIYRGDLTRSLNLGLEALAIHKKMIASGISNTTIGPSWYNLSEIYFQLGKLEESRTFARHLIQMDNKDDVVGVAFGHYLMARNYLANDQIKDAMVSIDSAIYYFSNIPNGEMVNIVNGAYPGVVNLQAQILIEQGKPRQALSKYRILLKQANRNGEYYHSAVTHLDIADLFITIMQSDSTIYHATKGLKLSENLSYVLGILRASEILSSEYSNNDLQKAVKFYKRAAETRQSLYGLGNVQVLRDMVEERDAQNRKLRIAQEDYLERRRQLIFLLTALALAGLALIFFWNSRRIKKVNGVLQSTLTNLKATQSQLIQSEKMASLGELTAGIAHEIQNPLNFVNNFSEVNTELIDELVEEINEGNYDEVKELAKDIKSNEEKIKHHGSRADSIVKGMLKHSRTNSGEKTPTDINAICDEYLRLAYHGLRAKNIDFNAKMETDFDESIGSINVVAQDISRVILNLITNAFQACASRSDSTSADRSVSTLSSEALAKADSDYQPLVSVTTKRLNNSTTITVQDNGPGIPDAIKDKIFQPFFTTKATGQGTGLGLSLAYDIVKAHGGELRVESEEGEGAAFTITLPI